MTTLNQVKQMVKQGELHVDSLVQEVLSKSGEGSKKFSDSHMLWLRREMTKLLRMEVALEERDMRLKARESKVMEKEFAFNSHDSLTQ